MNVLVVGSGGREHALAWKLSQSPAVEKVFVAPGNPGMGLDEKVQCCPEVAASDFEGIYKLCLHKLISFVVVGPDQALADGLVDFLEARGIATYGPTKKAALLEASKAFSKEIMQKVSIPTAKFETFTEFAAAKQFLETVEWGAGWVVKADGLALGKGVVVCDDREDAIQAAQDFLQGSMGDAGKKLVIEELLQGREVSAFYLCDGSTAVQLGFACDYKRIFDGDQGPNTGGMGAYSPADWLPSEIDSKVRTKVIKPLLAEMKERGMPFHGTLFIGLMMTKNGPKVLEFNARFGDPETQALLPRIDEDLLPWLQACREGKLADMPEKGLRKKKKSSVHVVIAAAGYPGTGGQVVRKGDKITLPDAGSIQEDEKIFFAGVTLKDSAEATEGPSFFTSGGRVLGVTALADDREDARKKAYAIAAQIHFEGAQRRCDVGR